MLKKRYDLIPNLVAAVKGYMQHEQNLLTEITELRGKAMNENIATNEKVMLDNKIAGLLAGIFARVENYPNLKASENVLHLQASLNEIEEQISAARRAFNAAINDYNNGVEMFPSNIVAGIMGLKRRNFFEIAEEERKNVKVSTIPPPPSY